MAQKGRVGVLNPGIWGEARGGQQSGIVQTQLGLQPHCCSQPDSGQEADGAWETTGWWRMWGLPYEKAQRQLETGEVLQEMCCRG